jgi:hypothetical protein
MSNSPTRSRGAFAPGSLKLNPHREGWAERRQAPGCSGTRLGVQSTPGRLRSALRPHSARKTRVNALTAEGRAPLGAPPWRFLAGGRASVCGIILRNPCSELLAARSYCLAGGAPGLPGLRLRAASRDSHTSLRQRDRLRRRPSMSETDAPTSHSICSQQITSVRIRLGGNDRHVRRHQNYQSEGREFESIRARRRVEKRRIPVGRRRISQAQDPLSDQQLEMCPSPETPHRSP